MSKEKIEVNCTWGDGPDVLVSVGKKDCLFLDKFGVVQIDLTAEEAMALSSKFYFAAQTAMELEKMYNKLITPKRN